VKVYVYTVYKLKEVLLIILCRFYNMKHYLVTGGAGFIGSNLIKTLFSIEPGIKITCIDDFDPFYSPAIKQFNIRDIQNNPGFRLLTNDIGNYQNLSVNPLML